MNYKIFNNRIEIFDSENFNIEHILECGQIFTYDKTEKGYLVFSKNHLAEIENKEVKKFQSPTRAQYIIKTKSPKYFVNFFDLETDYKKIKNEILALEPKLKEKIDFGHGIRILKQDILEVIIGFIISANNNIKRIKKTMSYIIEKAGDNLGNYNAFPSLEKLSLLNEDFFIKAGAGYRAKLLVKTILKLKEINFLEMEKLETSSLRKELIKLDGVGGKVADCILLFGFSRKDVFPVDTWIEKIFHYDFDMKEKNRENMRRILVEKFGALSGYVQQYAYYYKRTKK